MFKYYTACWIERARRRRFTARTFTSNALPCPQCLTLLATKKKYTAHLKTHTRPFKCNVAGCNASFALRKDRDRHTKEQHGSTRWHCNFPGCTYKLARDGAPRKANVERHVRSWHKVRDPAPYCQRR
ncbi:hypothetical protein AU210_015586 [Fusarium oxysporum f. sp. radicis-cucumerinum]|uniref:C2H2-type domain-containing protein n=1 Tax=Fusarium oxysporum f. sp. radicis-cucumerinum TaxID=327505 RepID=A0A2H3G7W9_FUSOX|nr:hypothetical protein AU210_015586 [Fusarium oxysporum f. sp. radicis-cucumerinum]